MKNSGAIAAISAAMLLTCPCSVPAFAQQQGRFAVGANVGVRAALDSSTARGGPIVGLLWRFGQSHEGWGWHYGLGWCSTDVGWEIGDQTTHLGRLSVKPIMAGYGYTHMLNSRAAVSASLVGGYAINSLRPQDDFDDTLHGRLGVDSVAIRPSPTPSRSGRAWASGTT